MVVEQEILPYWEWLLGNWWRDVPNRHLGAALYFLIAILVLALVALLVGFLVALVRHGPLKAGDMTYRAVKGGLAELSRTSWRRVWALARLSIKEAIRRRVLVALVIFFLVLLFASWFLDPGYREPGRLFFGVALTTTTFLTLLVALIVSAFSLPQDFKSNAIHTVVTKPVRAGDIVLGKILGFTIVGTVMLAVMAAGSYVFVWRMLDHSHEVELASLENIVDVDNNVVGKKGRTSLRHSHRHDVELDPQGNGIAFYAHGHEHAVHAAEGSTGRYKVTGPLEIMRARVPYYGSLEFLGRSGVPVTKGINVGAEWTYRSYIEGGTSGAAIWTFDDIDASKFRRAADGSQVLPLELIVRVFRTYKGIIGQGIQGSIQLRNPDTGLRSDLWTFTAKDAGSGIGAEDRQERQLSSDLPSVNLFAWPRKLDDVDRNQIDLLDDLVGKDGRLEVWVQCLEREQYYGFARPDCYVRLSDASPFWNFCKAQVSIWVQMVLVIAIAVAISTLVNGPVAMLFTASFILLGFCRDFFVSVGTGDEPGGGPIESLVRIVTQRNLFSGLNEGFAVDLMHMVDGVLRTAMVSVAKVLPDFHTFSTANYVADGFNIPLDKVLQDVTFGVAYVAGVSVFGYFFLRSREVAK